MNFLFFLLVLLLNVVQNTPIQFKGCFIFKESTATDVVFYQDKLCNHVTEQSCINEFDIKTRSKVSELKYECKFATMVILIESEILSKYPNVQTVDISSLEAPALNVILNGNENFNVNTLKASNNNLRHVPKSLFKLMPNISEIDFSYNHFQILKSTCFDGGQKIMKISFFHNHLSLLENGVFANLNNLQSLDLGANQLKSLESRVFLDGDKM